MLVCLMTAGAASAAGTGAMAGKLTAKKASKQERTVSQVVQEACARGEKVVATVSRTEPRFFAGRMVPRRVEAKQTVCN